MSPGTRVPLLCSALLYRTLPPAGCAATFLSCRHRVLVHRAVNHSGGSSREDGQGSQEAAEVPGSASSRLPRRAWSRSLSPLDRVSRLIPPEFISKEVQDLQRPDPSPEGEGSLKQVAPPPSSLGDQVAQQEDGRVSEGTEQVTPTQSSPFPPPRTLFSEPDFGNMAPPQVTEASEESYQPQPPTCPPSPTSHTAPEADSDLSPSQGAQFIPGDLLLAEYKRKHHSMFKKMFLLKPNGKLTSNWGAIRYQDIVGKLPGQIFHTSTGHRLLLRRPSLEEYVMFMKRGPNISYPKDMAAMMMVMDISPGDVVLEAGSGSGAFTLFLSRAVGSEGCVYSFDVRADHHEVAKKNFSAWRKAWQIRSGRTWPDNAVFTNKSIVDALPDIKSVAFDAVVLDMLNPQMALPVIVGSLKQGAVCALYITNITQVIDLLEGIRCCKLPLKCEKIIEVGITDWLVAPSIDRDGRISKRVEPHTLELPKEEDHDDEDETDEADDYPVRSQAFGQVPYIARPLPWQLGHTAFLVHLRKFQPALPTD